MREPCYKCKFEHKQIAAEPCGYCSDVYIKTGDHPAFQYAKPITNYDSIVRKTPEELADYFSELTCFPGANRDICKGMANCMYCWLDWLKQEATE